MTQPLRSTGRRDVRSSGSTSRNRRRSGRVIAILAVATAMTAGCGRTDDGASIGETGGAATSAAEQEEGSMIEGTITIEGEGDGPVAISGLIVRLQDTSRADASARTVAETAIGAVTAADQPVRFRLAVPDDLDPSGSYTVSAHADLDGSGDISVGDYITMAANPVVVDGTQPPIDLLLRLVTS